MPGYKQYSYSSMLAGPMSSRPPAGQAGRIYTPNDSNYIHYFLDNGNSWDTYVGGFKCSNPPAPSTFKGINTATYTNLESDGDALLVTQSGSGSSGEFQAAYVQPLPDPPYQLVLGLQPIYMWSSSYTMLGIALANDYTISAKLATWIMIYRATGVGGFRLQNPYYNNPTNWNSDNVIHGPWGQPFNQPMFFMRIRDDGTYRYYEWSADTRTWFYYTDQRKARTDFLTYPLYGGISIARNVAATANIICNIFRVLHWYLGPYTGGDTVIAI